VVNYQSSPSTTTTPRPINDGGFFDGLKNGQSQASVDERGGRDNANCSPEHTNPYCDGYIAGYVGEHAHFNILHNGEESTK
jgi:hypothetical protein